MRYIAEFDAMLDQYNWTIVFQIACLVYMLTNVFMLQYAEKLDGLLDKSVERMSDQLGWSRRATTIGVSLVICWLMIYQLQTGWQPWPPVVGLVLAMTCQTVTRLMIIYVDYCRIRRLSSMVDDITDMLPRIRREELPPKSAARR